MGDNDRLGSCWCLEEGKLFWKSLFFSPQLYCEPLVTSNLSFSYMLLESSLKKLNLASPGSSCYWNKDG